MVKSKKKEKSGADEHVLKIAGHLILIYIAVMAGAGTALSYTIKTMTGLGILFLILLLVGILIGLIFCVEGYFRKNEKSISISRWILYVCLGLLIAYIINIIFNRYHILIQQVPFPTNS